MNKQELIEKYKEYEREACQRFLKALEQLDEPEKVKVPQIVADWYEKSKDDFEGNLFRCVHNIPSTFDGAKLNEFERWFLNASTKPFQTLVNMHQFGYEVEEEKRYRVKIKNVYHGDLGHAAPFEQFSFYTKERNHSGIRYEFNRKELEEADFGWVFDCPGIEIKEVE